MGHGEEQDCGSSRPLQGEAVGATSPWPLCACGCGIRLTKRQTQRGGKYVSLSCSRQDALTRPSVRAAIVRNWVKAAETNKRKYYARVRAEVLDVCRDVLGGAEPTREILAVAARMRRLGYNAGWRVRWARQSREKHRGAA